MVEHILGKDEVTGSNPVMGSIELLDILKEYKHENTDIGQETLGGKNGEGKV